MIAAAASTLLISSTASVTMTSEPPAPPYCSATSIPMRPSSKYFGSSVGIDLPGLLHLLHARPNLFFGESGDGVAEHRLLFGEEGRARVYLRGRQLAMEALAARVRWISGAVKARSEHDLPRASRAGRTPALPRTVDAAEILRHVGDACRGMSEVEWRARARACRERRSPPSRRPSTQLGESSGGMSGSASSMCA